MLKETGLDNGVSLCMLSAQNLYAGLTMGKLTLLERNGIGAWALAGVGATAVMGAGSTAGPWQRAGCGAQCGAWLGCDGRTNFTQKQ